MLERKLLAIALFATFFTGGMTAGTQDASAETAYIKGFPPLNSNEEAETNAQSSSSEEERREGRRAVKEHSGDATRTTLRWIAQIQVKQESEGAANGNPRLDRVSPLPQEMLALSRT